MISAVRDNGLGSTVTGLFSTEIHSNLHESNQPTHIHNIETHYKPSVIYISAAKRFIVINSIQNTSICMCAVYIYYVYINTHTYSIYISEKYIMYFIY